MSGTPSSAESHARTQPTGERRTDPADTLQTRQGAEGTERLAVSDDPAREGGTDPRELVEFLGGCGLHVDQRTRCRWLRSGRAPSPPSATSAELETADGVTGSLGEHLGGDGADRGALDAEPTG